MNAHGTYVNERSKNMCYPKTNVHVLNPVLFLSFSVPGPALFRAVVSRSHEGGQTDGRATDPWILCGDRGKWWHLLGQRERYLRHGLHTVLLVQHPISWSHSPIPQHPKYYEGVGENVPLLQMRWSTEYSTLCHRRFFSLKIGQKVVEYLSHIITSYLKEWYNHVDVG